MIIMIAIRVVWCTGNGKWMPFRLGNGRNLEFGVLARLILEMRTAQNQLDHLGIGMKTFLMDNGRFAVDLDVASNYSIASVK